MTLPLDADATEIAAMIRNKDITPLEAVDAAIARAEELQPQLNFLVTDQFERARDRARAGVPDAPFAGVPYLLKDMFDQQGVTTRWGSRFSAVMPPAAADSPQVQAFEAAGLVIIGRSALGEFGFLPTTEPVAFGPTRNPWNTDRSPGGSSGGSAAAVAAGVLPMADAADGGGSIRIPASACGLFGLKPSRRRLIGDQPPSAGIELTVEHCVSRTVRDSAGLFAATEDPSNGLEPVGAVTAPGRRRLRIGYLDRSLAGAGPDPQVAAAMAASITLLEELGHSVEPTAYPFDAAALHRDFTAIWSGSAAHVVALITAGLGATPDESILEPYTLAMARSAADLGPDALERAAAGIRAAEARYAGWFTDLDIVLSPVVMQEPVPIGTITGSVPAAELVQRLTAHMGCTPLQNAVGAPAMSVPLHWTPDGLPIGSHFAARVGAERTLFELAYELEQARPWAHRRPPVSARA